MRDTTGSSLLSATAARLPLFHGRTALTVIEIISEKDRKARKPHICDYCGGTIEAGEVYNHCVIKGDDIYTWDAHIVCKSVASDLWDYIDPWEGMTADDFQEGCQEFCRTFICPDCKQWNDGCEQEEPF